MKKFFLLAFLLIAQPVLADVLISEVLYDPINTENGGEAILLHNNDYEEVDVSGWVIATKASSADAVLPLDTSIPAKGYLLIADEGFSLNKDNLSWPDADYEEAITLSNTNAGVALKNGNTTLDAVGWGNQTLIGEEFYEGTPHTGVVEGESLRRVSETNDNSVDFMGGTPVFSTTPDYDPLETLLDLEINITGSDPEIVSINITTDDNSSKEGIQVQPVAGESRIFTVTVETLKPDNNSEANLAVVKLLGEEYVLQKTSLNETNDLFTGNISMNYFEMPGYYNLTATIIGNETNVSQDFEFEYMELAAMEAEGSIGFSVKPGEEETRTVTINNLGNVEIDLQIKGTGLSDGENNLSLSSITYSTDSFVTSYELSEQFASLGVVEVNSNREIDFRILGDNSMEKGSYKGIIVVKGQT